MNLIDPETTIQKVGRLLTSLVAAPSPADQEMRFEPSLAALEPPTEVGSLPKRRNARLRNVIDSP